MSIRRGVFFFVFFNKSQPFTHVHARKVEPAVLAPGKFGVRGSEFTSG